MIEIISDTPDDILDKYLDPTQTEKLPDHVKFKVAVGKKEYDIIRYYQNWQEFYSHRIIDVLSLFVDMSDKCYPIKIDGVDKQYYVIYNLETYPFWNRDETISMSDEPYIFGVQDKSIPIFGIDDTGFVIVSEKSFASCEQLVLVEKVKKRPACSKVSPTGMISFCNFWRRNSASNE